MQSHGREGARALLCAVNSRGVSRRVLEGGGRTRAPPFISRLMIPISVISVRLSNLTLKALKCVCINHGDQSVFSI